MSDKPSWDDAPEWAQWLTQDKDGRWVWWDDKPKEWNPPQDEYKWPPPEFWVIGTFGSTTMRAGQGRPNPDWRNTLEQRPERS